MNHKIALAAALTLAAVLVFYTPAHETHHNLISLDEANAFNAFEAWIIEQGKAYRNAEEKTYRFTKFRANYLLIQEHNARFAAGKETYDLAVNKFADLDRYEFKALYLGLKNKQVTTACHGSITPVANPPASVDWAAKGVVTPLKDQGQCGSCWAFSTTGSLEGLRAIEKGSLLSFSEQQLVDCAGGPYQNEGCNGGDMDLALCYVIDNGIALESAYPYKARDQKCAYKDTMKAYQIRSCANVPANKTAALISAVVAQPVSISVEADQTSFQFFKSGVLSSRCGTNLDHGILLTGYGNLNGVDYWRAKNSWGASWGDKGYINIARGADGPGVCGILMDNVVPLESL